jgi:outer membrane receptor protein involved in Fe transport
VVKDEWRLNVRHVSSRNLGAGLGMATIISPEEYFDVKDTQINLTYHRPEWKPNWDILAQAGYRHFAEDFHNVYSARPGAIRGGQLLSYGAPNKIGAYQHQAHFDFSATYRGFNQHTVRFGAGYAYLDLYDTPWQFLLDKTVPVMVDVHNLGMALIPENIRQNRYLLVQDTWRFHPEWELTLGVRHDWYSDFAGETNPRMGLVWEVNPSLTTKILYGTSFRAPSFIEMYAGENQVIIGNPDLKAEKSKTWEMGVDYRITPEMNTALTLFDYRVQDKIQQQLVPNPQAGVARIFAYNNIGTLRGNGLEWEGRWRVNSQMSLTANYAYTRVESDQGEAGHYPHHQAYLRHDWLLGKNWFLNSSLNWILDRDRSVNDMRPPLADYATLNFSLRYAEWADTYSWHFVAGLRNALDEERREPGDIRLMGDYPKAGREWFGEIRYRF